MNDDINRYDWEFRSLPAEIRAHRIQRAFFARGGILRHRINGFGSEDDEEVVRQFNLSGLNEYWDIELSEPMSCQDFAHLLSIHFMNIEVSYPFTEENMKAGGRKAMQFVDFMKVHILSALRAARGADEPWFLVNPETRSNGKLDAKAWFGFVPSDVVIVPPEPPSDGIDLSKLRVRPRAAAEWLLAMPKRRHLVPPSLATFLASVSINRTTETKAPEQVPKSLARLFQGDTLPLDLQLRHVPPPMEQEQLEDYCKAIDENGLTFDEFKKRVSAHFDGLRVTAEAMRKAFKVYPGKRQRGDTDKTLAKYKR